MTHLFVFSSLQVSCISGLRWSLFCVLECHVYSPLITPVIKDQLCLTSLLQIIHNKHHSESKLCLSISTCFMIVFIEIVCTSDYTKSDAIYMETLT